MKMRKKADLPQKECVACGLPFTWRRKWARDWEQVKYCSDRCRSTGATRGTPHSTATDIAGSPPARSSSASRRARP